MERIRVTLTFSGPTDFERQTQTVEIMRVTVLILALICSVTAQSGRTTPAANDASLANKTVSQTVKELFEEANAYLRTKAAEFEVKKIPFSDRLFEQTQLEQRQLAAKYATTAGLRKDLAGDDYYYLGMLHWIAENFDGASENLETFVSSDGVAIERVQSARAILTVIAAKQNKLDSAESTLKQYLEKDPKRASELYRMEVDLAKAYQPSGEFSKMGIHAEAAYAAAKASLRGPAPKARTLDEILDAGMLVFEAYSRLPDQKRADGALDALRNSAVETGSPSLFYYAVDKKINYLIETGRKPEAIQLYLTALVDAKKEMPTDSAQADAFARLSRREKHYKLLGSPAPEFPEFDVWLPGKPVTFAQLRGKVVMIDFWAMWCGPCITAFPSIKEWHQEFGKDGFEILGATRYYGDEVGAKTPNEEIDLLKAFRAKYALPYDFVVAKDQILQNLYGATALPTAVLIDRKGIIRYIETGTGPTRLVEMRAMIVKLLAEK
jgi:thiol-disulfide isomerase/thioredoxin